MLDKEDIQSRILDFAKRCRIFKAEHIARWFDDYSRPEQKAREYLEPLIKQKLLETKEMVTRKPRGVQPQVYRLTRKGRELVGATFYPIAFTSSTLTHWFMIGHTYLDMCEIERPYYWEPEQRLNDGQFCPDIFAIWQKRAMWIEVQNSAYRSKQWEQKWRRYKDYIKSGKYLREDWNNGNIKPRIVVVSTQMPSTIMTGVEPPIEKFDIVQNIKELQFY